MSLTYFPHLGELQAWNFWPDSRPVLKGVVAQCPHMGRSSGKEMAAFLLSLATLVQMVEVVVYLSIYIFLTSTLATISDSS